MAPSSNSIPYFPSTVNIMRYHSAIQLYYTAQLMSPEGNFLAGPDLILWTLKSKKVSQAGGRKKSERDLRFEKDFQLSAVFEGGHVRRNADGFSEQGVTPAYRWQGNGDLSSWLQRTDFCQQPGWTWKQISCGLFRWELTPANTLITVSWYPKQKPITSCHISDPPNCELIGFV